METMVGQQAIRVVQLVPVEVEVDVDVDVCVAVGVVQTGSVQPAPSTQVETVCRQVVQVDVEDTFWVIQFISHVMAVASQGHFIMQFI